MPFRILRQVRRRGELETLTKDHSGNILPIGRGTDNDLHLEDLSVHWPGDRQ